jgi:hypothetical protein
MPKFGNNIETNITEYPQWGDFIDISVERKGRKNG